MDVVREGGGERESDTDTKNAVHRGYYGEVRALALDCAVLQ